MTKTLDAPPPYGSPRTAPPSYAQAIGGGVPPSAPFVPTYHLRKDPEILTTIVPVGPSSTHMVCPHCGAEIDTSTKSKPGLKAYILGALIAAIGGCFGCCLIPCCMEQFMVVKHTCPNCDNYLCTYKRM